MSLFTKCLAGVALATIAASTVSAESVRVSYGPGDILNDENVLFKDYLTNTGPLVQGVTEQTRAVVDFYGADEDLVTVAQGQSRITGADGDFTKMTIGLHTPDALFTSLMFNLDVRDGAGDGKMNLTINLKDEAPVEYKDLFLDDGGQNFFRIEAIDPEKISSISFISTVALSQLSDIQQVRIGGVTGATAVPLPAAALPGGAMLAVGAVVRTIRRRRQA